MSVLASQRTESKNENIMLIGSLREMIIHDQEKITKSTPGFISKYAIDAMRQISDLGDKYVNTYVPKTRYENGLRRNIYLIEMNDKLFELNCFLPSFFDAVPKISKRRMLKYTEIINQIIEKNESRIIRHINMGEDLFSKIFEYDDYMKGRCKMIMNDDNYRFKRGIYFYRSHGEKAEYVRKAENLKKYTLKQIKKLNIAQRYVYGENLYRMASMVFYNCHCANTILPLCLEEYEERRGYLEQAKKYVQGFDRELAAIISSVYYETKTANAWAKKSFECYRLINVIMESDKKRFSKLPLKKDIKDFDKKKTAQRKKYNETVKQNKEKGEK